MPQAKQRPTLQQRSASVPVLMQPPHSVLKTKARIPLELQAVFLESSRNGIVDRPAPKAASKIFGIRWTPKIKVLLSTPTEAVSDGELDSSVRSTISTNVGKKQRRRFLIFGANETFLFEKRNPTNVRFNKDNAGMPKARPTLSRWNSGLDQKEACLTTMPRPMPRRNSPRL